jgi:hypothetical protein
MCPVASCHHAVDWMIYAVLWRTFRKRVNISGRARGGAFRRWKKLQHRVSWAAAAQGEESALSQIEGDDHRTRRP